VNPSLDGSLPPLRGNLTFFLVFGIEVFGFSLADGCNSNKPLLNPIRRGHCLPEVDIEQ
jgi:hypothetical protein